MSIVIQNEMAEMSERITVLSESIRQLVTDKRLPENSRLMEIRATNRELMDIAGKVDRTRIHLLTCRQLQPLDKSD